MLNVHKLQVNDCVNFFLQIISSRVDLTLGCAQIMVGSGLDKGPSRCCIQSNSEGRLEGETL